MLIPTSSVQAYFELLPVERDAAMRAIRETIKRIWPKIKEDMAHGMPTYHLNGRTLFAFASMKNFVVFHVVPHDLLNAFKNDLRVHNHGKTCLRFKYVDDAAVELIDRVVRYVGSTYMESKWPQKNFVRV